MRSFRLVPRTPILVLSQYVEVSYADDLLATFDDQRATAAIGLLSRLGGEVQTILFTHHAHLAALAARQGVAVVRLPPG